VRHVVGFPGGSEEARVWVLRRHGFFWCQLAGDGHNRCWNGFGLVMPEEARVLPLVVEINVPWEGVNRRIGGVFLRGPRGEVYVGHRGRIGGGRKLRRRPSSSRARPKRRRATTTFSPSTTSRSC
jgi:5-methylcytosine-specific restriction protein A